MKRNLIFTILLVFITSSTAFSMGNNWNRVSQDTTLKGTVTDQYTKSGIDDAAVQVYQWGKLITTTTSDSQGNYLIKKPLNGIYTIKASRSGYRTRTWYRYFRYRQSYTLNFILVPLKKPNTAPKITSMKPSQRATYKIGDTIAITIKATDKERDRLMYRYLIDGKVKKNWSRSSRYNFKAAGKDKGRHKIKVEVRDTKKALASKEADIFIFVAFPKPGR